MDCSDKRCRIIGRWVKETDSKYSFRRVNKEYYYKLNELEAGITTENLFTAPVQFTDVGIGGGEKYFLCGNNHNQTVLCMIGNTYKIRLIYGNKSIVGSLSPFGSYKESIVVDTKDGYCLECTLKECDIEILEENH